MLYSNIILIKFGIHYFFLTLYCTNVIIAEIMAVCGNAFFNTIKLKTTIKEK